MTVRLHPASIPIRSLSRSVSTGSLFFFVGLFTSSGEGATNLLVVGGMVALGIVVGVAYEVAYYRRFRYELTADTFDVASGVVSRRDREIPLGRIQNVDVRQNALDRALGVAAVRVETAGGGETEVTLRYVAADESRRLQRRLRTGAPPDAVDEPGPDSVEATVTATGSTTGDGTVASHGPAAGHESAAGDEATAVDGSVTDDDVEGEPLFELRPGELVVLSVFTIDPGASVLASVVVSFASGFDPTTLVPPQLLRQELLGSGLAVVLLGTAIFAFAAWVLSAALTFTRYYGFRLIRIGDELHYERGLVQRYSGTIPLEKVQALTIKESVPFRWGGFAALSVETAGYAPGRSGSRGTESAIPLASRDRVLALARTIEPLEKRALEPFEEGPLDPIEEALERPPIRARERYAVRYVGVLCAIMAFGYGLATYTVIVEDWHAFAALLGIVPPAAHYKWRSRGFRTGDRHLLTRTGFWRRTTKVVPYYRVQGVITERTIFQRRRGLASVTADTASSASFFGRAATAIDVDVDRAEELQGILTDRLQERLRARTRRSVSGHSDVERWSDVERGTDLERRSPGSARPRQSRRSDGADDDSPDGGLANTDPSDDDSPTRNQSDVDDADDEASADGSGR